MARIIRETVADRAVAALRADIFESRLRPGDALREEAVAKELGVSRPTVREVFKTLLAEGLLARNGSTRVLEVTHLDAEDIREIYHARRFLELSGVDAAGAADPAALAALQQALADMDDAVANDDPVALVDADTRVHEVIVGFLGSHYLSQLHRMLMLRLRLAMSRVEQHGGREHRSVFEAHRDFCAQLLAGDLGAARANLEARLRAAEEVILRHEAAPAAATNASS